MATNHCPARNPAAAPAANDVRYGASMMMLTWNSRLLFPVISAGSCCCRSTVVLRQLLQAAITLRHSITHFSATP